MDEVERNSEKFNRGLEQQKAVWGDLYKRPSLYEQIDPELHRIVIETLHCDVLSRPGLDLKTRELLTVALLVAQGAFDKVELHIHGSLNVGCTREQLVETLIQAGFYVGFPKMHSALAAAKKVFDERGV